METLILGWYVLVETGSVLLLTLFASLLYLGTLIAPMFGVVGDRIGHRAVLCAMRAFYAVLAATLMTFALTGVLTPLHVFVIVALMGLVRPSDIGVRAAVVGDTMPSAQLMGAMSIQRTTSDSARIAGALSGAGLVAMLGMGRAYLVVTGLYALSVWLTWKAGERAAAMRHPAFARASPWRELKEGVAYVRRTPHLLAMMFLAFLFNFGAFPLMNGLLPYVAREIYRTDRTGLGYMSAGAAFGALLGSIVLSRYGGALRPARTMIVFCLAWFALLLVFAHTTGPETGVPMLIFAGFAQSLAMIPLATVLLRNSDEQFRGRVMGLRMLAIYGNLPGLLLSAPLIDRFGYAATASLYCTVGIVFTVLITLRWRAALWRHDAPSNTR